MGAGMLGFLGNMIPTLPDFAGAGMNEGIRKLTGGDATSKARKNYIHDTRQLRRKSYQDMVYSLKKAGLNPILAVGASPGNSSAQMQMQQPTHSSSSGAGAGYASAKQAAVAESKAPSEIGVNEGKTGLMSTENQNLMLGRAGLLQQYEMNELEMAAKKQGTQTSFLLGEVYKEDAINKGASAREIEQRMREIDQYGLPGQTWEGLIRNRVTGDEGKPGIAGQLGENGRRNLNKGADAILNSAKSAWDWGRSQFQGDE